MSFIIKNLEKAEQIPTRNGFGQGLVEAASADERIVALSADLVESTRTLDFKKKFPDRFIEMGVAEQNLATVAAGLSAGGKIPVITSYAMFSPGRNWEQIRTTIAYNDRHVIIAGAHAGISVGPDGATHQAVEDIAIMRVMPNMTVLVPCDANETRKALIAAARYGKPVYLRFAREKTAVFTQQNAPFEIGKAQVFREGDDAAIIACGPMVYEALLAAEFLKKQHKLDIRVVNCPSIKPLDHRTIRETAEKCGCIVTVEEHQQFGGLGSAVAEYLSQSYPVPMFIMGIADRFGESGQPDELLTKFGLKSRNIVSKVLELLRKKWPDSIPMATEMHHEVRNVIGNVKPHEYFKTVNGGVIRNLPELKEALETMSESTFRHHVTNKKNDFGDWIRGVFKDDVLAHLVSRHNSKQEMAEVVHMRVKHAERRLGW